MRLFVYMHCPLHVSGCIRMYVCVILVPNSVCANSFASLHDHIRLIDVSRVYINPRARVCLCVEY